MVDNDKEWQVQMHVPDSRMTMRTKGYTKKNMVGTQDQNCFFLPLSWNMVL